MTLTPVAGRGDLQDGRPASTGTTPSARPCPGGSSPSSAALVTVHWLAADVLRRHARPAGRADGEGRELSWPVDVGLTSCPARSPAALSGWFIIQPVNAVLARVFRGFNRLFRPHHRTATAGASAGCCASASIVLVVYGGLLVLTGWTHRQVRPPGFIPDAGPGLPAGQRAAARLGLRAARRKQVMDKISSIALGDPDDPRALSAASPASRTRCRSPGSRSC